jgi:hypothetical protein
MTGKRDGEPNGCPATRCYDVFEARGAVSGQNKRGLG